MRIRIAAAQMAVTNDVAANVLTIERAIDFAADEGAEILLTPEGSLSGYRPDFNANEVDSALRRVFKRACQARVGLALGTCFIEPNDGRCYNQLRFSNVQGQFLGFHSKILRCGTCEQPPKGKINDYATGPLQTFDLSGITIGGLICNDLWATPHCTPMPDPHLSQQLANQGARIVFHAVNGGRDGGPLSRQVYWPYHEANLRIRAISGKLWIVTVDNAFPFDMPCSAPSGVVSPRGDWVTRANPQGEQFFTHTIDLE